MQGISPNIIHSEASNAERSTDLEDRYREFRSQAHALALVPSITFANDWVKKRHRHPPTLYVTFNGWDVKHEFAFQWKDIAGKKVREDDLTEDDDYFTPGDNDNPRFPSHRTSHST